MDYSGKSIFYFPFVYIIILLFKISWFPLAGIIEGKEILVFIVIFASTLLINLNLNKLELSSVKFSLLNLILLILFSLILFSTVFVNSQEIQNFQNLLKFLTLFLYIILFAVIFPKFIYFNPDYYLKFIRIVTNFGMFTAIFGILLYLSGFKPIHTAELLISFVKHPNGVSIIFSVTTLTTLYYYFWKRDYMTFVEKSLVIFSFFLQLLAELLTQSRTGIVGMLISIGLFIAIYYRKKVLFLIPLFAVAVNSFVIGYLMKKGAASFISRFKLWIIAYELLNKSRDTLLWGYGYSEGNEIFKKNAFIYTEIVEHPHNAYVSILLMFGLVILLFFLILMVYLLGYNLIKVIRTVDQQQKLYFNFLFSLLLSFLIQGLFESPVVLYWYFLMPFFLIIVGLIIANIRFPDLIKKII